MTDRPPTRPDRPAAAGPPELAELYRRWRAAEDRSGAEVAAAGQGVDAERAADLAADQAADQAFGALYAALPSEAPAPGFAERVLEARRFRAGATRVPAAPATAPAGRLAAAVLAALSLGTLLLAHLAMTLLPPVEVGEGVRRLTLGAAGLVELLAAAALAAERLVGYVGVVLEVLQTRQMAALLLAAALSAALGFRFLITLLARDRSTIDVRLS